MAKSAAPRIAILGAGCIGLEAALYARSLNLPVVVFEQGGLAEHLRHWGHVRLFSPFGMNYTPLGRSSLLAEHPRHEFPADGDCVTGREHLAAYLEPLSKLERLAGCLRLNTRVLAVGRRGLLKHEAAGEPRRAQTPFRLLLREEQKERVEEADVVLDCTGTYGQPRWLGVGGIPAVGETAAAPHLAYGLEDVRGERRQHFAGKTVLVFGAGHSAATTVCNLVDLALEHPDTWVIWAARGASSQPIRRIPGDPFKERDRLAVRANTLATRAEGNVEFHPQTAIEAVEHHGPDKGFRVRAVCGGRAVEWDVDRVIANVGYGPGDGLYRELLVMGDPRTLAPRPPATGGPRYHEPNFYVLGAKTFGRDPGFLLQNGFEQVRAVFALITGKPDLDLYKKR